jgi:hypothetical protein
VSEKTTPLPLTLERGNSGSDHPLFIVAPGKDGIRVWSDDYASLIVTSVNAHQALVAALKRFMHEVVETEECDQDCTAENCPWKQADEALKLAEGGKP